MTDFSRSPSLRGLLQPARFEADVYDCEVRGGVPPELDGAFYRMHGDWLYPPKPDDISLAADGYISMFRFKDGIVDYKGRYVRTDRFERQMRARRQLYGYYRNPFTDDPEVSDPAHPNLRTTANTTPVIHAGHLYATKEDGLAHRIDPRTLATLGPTDFGGAWKSQTFTAHPKVDPVSGEMVAFGYEADGLASRQLFLGIFDRGGKLTREWRLGVPHTAMMHDMAFTQRHVILIGGGGVTSMERLHEGKIHWAWDSRKPAYYGIVPRDGEAKDVRWFFGTDQSIVHTANAWSDGDRVFLDAPIADGNTWPWFEDLAGKPFTMHPFTIRRVTFDLSKPGDRGQEEVLFDTAVTSFTRVDERFLTLPYRYTWVQFSDATRPFRSLLPDDPRQQPVNSIGRFDVIDRKLVSWFAGETHVLQEPTFVPRPGGSAEGDGYLLATVHNLATQRTELVIVDAMQMQERARILLPFRAAAQVHGAWADARELPM